MQKLRIECLLIVLVALAIFAGSAAGQVTGGAVTGVVLDPNGAAVGGATVTLHNKATAADTTTQTTGTGSYNFPNVATGNYTMTVTAPGFTKATGDIVVSLNQTATANINLTVQGANAVVSVTSDTDTIVQTDTSQIGEDFKSRQFLDLPTGGDPNNLALLAPNVISPPIGVSGAGAITGGIRQRANDFTVDGVDNNDVGVSGNVRGVIPDSVSEFSFQQNNFNAEFASGGAGAFNTITKSGTNQFHGSLFTYIQSQKLNARTTEENSLPNKHFFKDVVYGFTIGGPLPYPHFGENDGPLFKSGKDKLFFFVAADRDFFKGEGASASYIAPTAAGLAQIAAAPGASQFSIGLIQKAMPLASSNQFSACSADGSGPILGLCVPEGIVNVPQPNGFLTHAWQVNIDANLNAKNQLRFRYYHFDFFSANGVLAPLFANDTTQSQKSFSANWISNLSASLINDARFGYINSATFFNQLHDNSQFNFPVLDLDNFGISLGPADEQTDSTKTFQYYDSLTWIRGSHSFKFGGEYIKRPNTIFFLPRHGGEYDYPNLDTFFQDLKPLPGDLNEVGIGNPIQPLGSHQWGFFGQDDWKIRHNLTLNLGVRWDYQSIYDVEKLQALSAPGDIPGVIDFHVPKTDKNNFAPRVGFAWAPSFSNGILHRIFGKEGDSSIRANYARSYVIAFSNLVSAGPPAALQGTLDQAGPATNFLAQGGATAGLPPFVFDNSAANIRATTGSLILDHVSPYVDSFAVSYQRQLNRSTGIEIRYLRTQGRKLFVQVQGNSRPVVDSMMVIPTLSSLPTAAQLAALPTLGSLAAANPILNGALTPPRQLPQFAGVLTIDPNIGKSNYNGISASVTRRMSRNVAFTAAYTFSRTYDNSFNELFTSSLNPRRSQDAGEFFQPQGLDLSHDYSRSIADVPHRFVASWIYEVPFKSSNSFANAVIGGWEITGIFQAQSGQLVDIQSGVDSNQNGDNAGDRAFFNPNGNINVGSGVVGLSIDPVTGLVVQQKSLALSGSTRAYLVLNPNAAWIQAGFYAAGLANGGAGLAPRNAYRTRSWNNTDMDFIKNTRFGKEGRYNFQIGAEAHNVFNQREINIAGIGSGARSFVEPFTAQFLNYSFGTYGGRTITMRAKFIF